MDTVYQKPFAPGVLLLAILLTFPYPGHAAQFQKPVGFVNDFANVIGMDKRQEIEAIVRDVEKKTSVEIVIATVPQCAPMDSVAYRNALFNEWHIGKQGKDNGVLMLLCLAERRMEIEVGYGLEDEITDGIAGSVLDKFVVPDFKAARYGDGFLRGAQAIAALILPGEMTMPSVSPDYAPKGNLQKNVDVKTLLQYGLWIIVFILIAGVIIVLLLLLVKIIDYLTKPRCPMCNLKEFVNRVNTRRGSSSSVLFGWLSTSYSYSSRYRCSQCNHSWTAVNYTDYSSSRYQSTGGSVSKNNEPKSRGGGSGGGSSGGFGGFGGGSSGGKGAGRSF